MEMKKSRFLFSKTQVFQGNERVFVVDQTPARIKDSFCVPHLVFNESTVRFEQSGA
jgi:hypothetical protein